jgi:hypothetical protein
LFRFLFQAYAEDRGLLPAGRNEHFDAHSLTFFASQSVGVDSGYGYGYGYGDGTGLWSMLQEVWEAIDVGNEKWQVPAYNGGLFGSDPALRPFGALIKRLSLTDAVIGPALEALLIDQTEDDITGMVDFRSLSVREFGTIYEGLLESSLSLAETDLAVNAKGVWLPARPGDVIEALAGEPYFHNTSGERKATGSYFTPDFIVDHLIERAIDPTLDEHLARIKGLLDNGQHNEAAKKFFDYRVADLAMGSAHFLVAAVDRIESKMRSFLAQPGNEIPGVSNELERLGEAARKALGNDLVAIDDIDDAVLLRRQIARRCVYGIDLNPLAVELSRLALWIHTFVPGLPMSTLDHNLRCGSSLSGFGSVRAAAQALQLGSPDNQLPIFDMSTFKAVDQAREILEEVANISEATQSEVATAQNASEQAATMTAGSTRLFNLALTVQCGGIDSATILDEATAVSMSEGEQVKHLSRLVQPIHFPVAFPEVFLRDNPGFDAIVGNPPWEKMHIDTVRWWEAKFPSLASLSSPARAAEIERLSAQYPGVRAEIDALVNSTNFAKKIVASFNWPGLGRSHIDLYQAFSWRNWELLRTGSTLGIVLPRGAMAGPAMQEWRANVLENGSFDSIIFAKNLGRWAFAGVTEQYTFIVATIRKGLGGPLRLSKPVENLVSFQSNDLFLGEILPEELRNWSTVFSIPTFETLGSVDIYRKLFASTKISNLIPKVQPSSEFNSTNDKGLFSFANEAEGDPVVAGRSFNLWHPMASEPFARIDRTIATEVLIKRKSRLSNPNDLRLRSFPADRYRIFFRDVARSTDPRTAISCLLPPHHFSLEGSPFLKIEAGEERFEAFLLGILGSLPFDWSARRWVELHFKFYILNDLPVPKYHAHLPLHEEIIRIVVALLAPRGGYDDWFVTLGESPPDASNLIGEERLVSKLDALASLAYGLERHQVEHIFETFHRKWDYGPRLSLVLEFYDEWKEKV